MDEEKVLKTMESRLKKLNKNYNQLTEVIKQYLFEIEREISNRLMIQEKSNLKIKDNKINISSIANSIDISRKTIYNNEILKDYINYAEKIYNNNYAKHEISNLKDTIEESKGIINKMVERDISIENLKFELEQLKNEVKMYEKENKLLQHEKLELLKEVQILKNRKKFKQIT